MVNIESSGEIFDVTIGLEHKANARKFPMNEMIAEKTCAKRFLKMVGISLPVVRLWKKACE